jgi:hypothetical protein
MMMFWFSVIIFLAIRVTWMNTAFEVDNLFSINSRPTFGGMIDLTLARLFGEEIISKTGATSHSVRDRSSLFALRFSVFASFSLLVPLQTLVSPVQPVLALQQDSRVIAYPQHRNNIVRRVEAMIPGHLHHIY